MTRKQPAVRSMEVANRESSDQFATEIAAPFPGEVGEWLPIVQPRQAGGVFELFMAQVHRTPGAVALQCGRRKFTYAEVLHKARSLAGALCMEGIGANDLVGILLDSPLDAIVCMLAVLDVGAAYVPLDASQPQARIAEIVGNAELALLLVDASTEQTSTAVGCLRSMNIHHPLANWQPSAPVAVTRSTLPQESDLAYVIYTSGTTGRPKGVMITRGNLLYSTQARIAYYEQPVERFLLLSPLTFDSSVAGIYWTLATGGALVIPEGPTSEAAAWLHRLIEEHKITHLLCIASLWNQVLGIASHEQLRSLRTVIVAGEACLPRLPARHFAMLPQVRLYNEYGPTEATVWCTVEEVVDGPDMPSVSIGLPIPGTKAYVLDEEMRPVAEGKPGELYVAGAGVAAGYRNQEQLTAQRFLVNPLENGPFSRMYRTGDLARRRADGRLEYVGRGDSQVKLRGFRIELGDVESHLMCHASVVEAAVVVRENQLIAFWLPTAEAATHEEAVLAQHMAARLPVYMCPARYVRVTSLPRTRHGKVDRTALATIPINGHAASPPRLASEASGTATEAHLLAIFREVLQRPVGVNDDFFQSGGDSLSSIDLLARVERQWNRTVKLSALMQHPTAARLARHLEGDTPQAGNNRLILLRRGDHQSPLVLLPPGGGGLVCYHHLLQELQTTRPIYGIQAQGLEDDAPPHRTVSEMVEFYWQLIEQENFRPEVHLAGWSFGGVVAYAMAAPQQVAQRRVASLTLLDCGLVYSFYVLKRLFPDQQIPLYLLNSADRQQFTEYFLRQGVEAGIVPLGANEAQARRILEVFAAGVAATADYRATAYEGSVHLLAASERWCHPRRTPEQEWSKIAPQLRTTLVPGDHLSMLKPPHVATLGRVLDAILGGEEGRLL